MAYYKYKDLAKRTASGKKIRDKALKLQIIQNMMTIKKNLLQSFINYFIKDLAKWEKGEIMKLN